MQRALVFACIGVGIALIVPRIKTDKSILKLMEEDVRLSNDIAAARIFYNEKINLWNTEINTFAVTQIVAHECGYTTRIPFIVAQATKEENKESQF